MKNSKFLFKILAAFLLFMFPACTTPEAVVQDKIEIFGDTEGKPYTIEYKLEGTDTWSSEGVELVSGQQEGLLAKLDTENIEDGRYSLRLNVLGNQRVTSQDLITFNVMNKFISEIINNELHEIEGSLTLKVQKLENDVWADKKTVVNNIPLIVEENIFDCCFFLLSDEWEDHGGFVAEEVGRYRVYAEFKIPQITLTDSFEFEVI